MITKINADFLPVKHREQNKDGEDGMCILLYKVRSQYVPISNIVDASIKHPISSQSTPMLKGCMNICLI